MNIIINTLSKYFKFAFTLAFIALFNQSFADAGNNWIKLKVHNDNYSNSILTISLKYDGQWTQKKIDFTSSSSNSDIIETKFELGSNTSIETLAIVWPESGEQVFNKIKTNQTLTIHRPDFPVSPSNFLAKVISEKQIDLAWNDNSDNEHGFIIERSIHPDRAFEQIALVDANVNIFSDNDLNVNTSYYYKIKAVSKDGFSLADGTSEKTEKNFGLVFEDVTQPIKMYPNPNQNFLDIRVNNDIMGEVVVRFLDEDGKQLKLHKFRKTVKDLKTKVEIASLPIGMFYVELSQIALKPLFAKTE